MIHLDFDGDQSMVGRVLMEFPVVSFYALVLGEREVDEAVLLHSFLRSPEGCSELTVV